MVFEVALRRDEAILFQFRHLINIEICAQMAEYTLAVNSASLAYLRWVKQSQ